MEILAKVLELLNDTGVKYALLFVVGLIGKFAPAFKSKAIPLALLTLSAILSTLAGMFPDVPAVGADPASFAFTSFAGVELHAAANTATRGASWLWNTLAPLAFAIATQSGPKNFAEWIQAGAGLIWPGGRPPVR